MSEQNASTVTTWDDFAGGYSKNPGVKEYAKRALSYFDELCPGVLSGQNSAGGPNRLLDFGCGPGELCAMLAPRAFGEIVGLDPSKGMLEVLRRRALPGVRAVQGAVQDRGSCQALLGTTPFDIIVSTSSVRFAPNCAEVMALLGHHALRRPGGHLLWTDNFDDTRASTECDLGADHSNHGFTEAEVRALMALAGVEVLTYDAGRSFGQDFDSMGLKVFVCVGCVA